MPLAEHPKTITEEEFCEKCVRRGGPWMQRVKLLLLQDWPHNGIENAEKQNKKKG